MTNVDCNLKELVYDILKYDCIIILQRFYDEM